MDEFTIKEIISIIITVFAVGVFLYVNLIKTTQERCKLNSLKRKREKDKDEAKRI